MTRRGDAGEPVRPSALTSWQLWQGDILLGTLVLTHLDQPFVYASFEATEAFEDVRGLFDEELRLLEDATTDVLMDAWGEAYDRVDSLGLSLKSLDGAEPITQLLLHIRGRDAWFRY